MSTIQAQIPDQLLHDVKTLAASEHITVDQLVAAALNTQVAAARTRETISSRARRVDWKRVDDILARVPAAPPLPGDEIH